MSLTDFLYLMELYSTCTLSSTYNVFKMPYFFSPQGIVLIMKYVFFVNSQRNFEKDKFHTFALFLYRTENLIIINALFLPYCPVSFYYFSALFNCIFQCFFPVVLLPEILVLTKVYIFRKYNQPVL